MTESKKQISDGQDSLAHIILNQHHQPKLFIEKLSLDAVMIERSMNGAAREDIAKNVRSPHIDETAFKSSDHISYSISFGSSRKDAHVLEVNFRS